MYSSHAGVLRPASDLCSASSVRRTSSDEGRDSEVRRKLVGEDEYLGLKAGFGEEALEESRVGSHSTLLPLVVVRWLSLPLAIVVLGAEEEWLSRTRQIRRCRTC